MNNPSGLTLINRVQTAMRNITIECIILEQRTSFICLYSPPFFMRLCASLPSEQSGRGKKWRERQLCSPDRHHPPSSPSYHTHAPRYKKKSFFDMSVQQKNRTLTLISPLLHLLLSSSLLFHSFSLSLVDFKPRMDSMAIATYRIADETGSILMTVKLDPSDPFKAGDIVRFQDWYATPLPLPRYIAPFCGHIHTYTPLPMSLYCMHYVDYHLKLFQSFSNPLPPKYSEVKSPGNRLNIQINATRGNNRFKRIGCDTKIFHEIPYWTEADWYWDQKLQHMVSHATYIPFTPT